MLINGEAIEEVTTEAFIEALSAVPSGFPHRVDSRTPLEAHPASDHALHAQAAKDAYQAWDKSDAEEDLDDALGYAQKAADAAHERNLPALQGNYLRDKGMYAMKGGREDVAIESLQQAADIHREHGQDDLLAHDLIGLYYTQRRHEDRFTTDPDSGEKIDRFAEGIKATQQELAGIWTRHYNEPQNLEAIRVEQHEIGFSSDQPIGTDNICECVVVMVHDPFTKKTALAHVDSGTPPRALDEIFDHLPRPGLTGDPLQVRLVGARYEDHAVAKRNLETVMRGLKDHPIEIISADVQEFSDPTTLVVNPENFTLTEEIPLAPNPDRFSATGYTMVQNSRKTEPLRIAFDLTVSDKRAPIKAGHDYGHHLKRIAGMDSEAILGDICQHGVNDGANILPVLVELEEACSAAYMQAFAPLEEACREKISKARVEGAKIGDVAEQKMLDSLHDIGIHFGQNADIANRPLLDFLNGNFLIAHRGDMVQNAKDLRDFKFPHKQPLDAVLEEEKGQGSFQSRLAGSRSNAEISR